MVLDYHFAESIKYIYIYIYFFNTVKLLTNNMQRFISKIVLFNNTGDRGLIISNFERSGLNFCLLILISYQNYLKRRMSRPNNGFISCFSKI